MAYYNYVMRRLGRGRVLMLLQSGLIANVKLHFYHLFRSTVINLICRIVFTVQHVWLCDIHIVGP